jgi:hypothetical protein
MSGTEFSIDIKTGVHSGGVVKDGVRSVELSWEEFHQKVTDFKADYWAWRGQRRDYPLNSSFDRHSRSRDQKTRDELLRHHITNFRNEINQAHPGLLQDDKDENEIWALGQHYGLHTPLLDWTRCPYVAAYFAFEKPSDPEQGDVYRYVYALDIRRLKRLIIKPSRDRFVDFIDKVKYPSPRFDAQKAYFTKALNGDDIERNAKRWSIKRRNEVILIKFILPTSDRRDSVPKLHEMGIDSQRLLLDLRDVVDWCNNTLRYCHGRSTSQQ